MTDLYSFKLEQIKNDPEQYAAFKSNVSTVVKAGPGSGKTTVLTLKIMNLLRNRIRPTRGLACITYSNEAAKEFTNRLKDFGYQKRSNVVLDTVHSFCISEVIIPFAPIFDKEFVLPLNIISKKEKNILFYETLKEIGVDRFKVTLTMMDKERNQGFRGDSLIHLESNNDAKIVAAEFERKLRNNCQVDFVEIIKCATKLIKEQAYVRNCLEAKFPWILIDEYQDLGKLLHEMVLTLLSETKIKIFAVGDVDQSIYGFQGAYPEYLLELYDIPNIISIDLKTNYRSNQDIIDASTIVLKMDDREYKAGTRLDEKAEFYFITCESEMLDQYNTVMYEIIPECMEKGIPLDEICVLVSNGDEIKELSLLMNQACIPHYVAKHEFLKSKIIVWLRDCASWVVADKSISYSEISNYWIGILTACNGQLSNKSIIRERKKLFDLLNKSKSNYNSLNEWFSFIDDELRLLEVISHSQLFIDDVDLVVQFQEDCQEGKYTEMSLEQFSRIGKPSNQVTLSTRHSSKGLEFEVIILLGMEDGRFPYYSTVDNEKELNEQRRIFFVCITRAKRVCYLLRSKRLTSRTRYGLRTHDKQPSMFWNELANTLEQKKLQITYFNR